MRENHLTRVLLGVQVRGVVPVQRDVEDNSKRREIEIPS